MDINIEEIYDKIYNDESTKEPRNFISIIESNKKLLDKEDFSNYDEYWKVTRLIADYSLALVNDGYLKKSLPYFNKALRLIENDEKLQHKDLLNEPLYEQLIFNRGMANYNLNQFKDSIPDFKRLVVKFKENDKYKNWYNGSIKMRFRKVEWTFWGLILFTAVLSFLFDKEDGLVDRISFYGLIFALIGSFSIDLLKRRQRIK